MKTRVRAKMSNAITAGTPAHLCPCLHFRHNRLMRVCHAHSEAAIMAGRKLVYSSLNNATRLPLLRLLSCTCLIP